MSMPDKNKSKGNNKNNKNNKNDKVKSKGKKTAKK